MLQAGLPKSGNLWLYKIIEEILRVGGVPPKRYIVTDPIYEKAIQWSYFEEQADIDYLEIEPEGCYFRKGSYRREIIDLDDYISKCSHVWTHSAIKNSNLGIYRKFDRLIYIIRDPRDVVVSASRYHFSPFMLDQHPQEEPDSNTFLQHRLYEIILTWIQHVGDYLLYMKDLKIYITFYERLLFTIENEIQSMASYLGIDIGSDDVEQIKDAVHFSSMKDKNPYHVRKGEWGQWVDILSPEQTGQIVKMTKPMLEILNYPLSTSQLGSHLPKIPGKLDNAEIMSAIRAGRGDYLDKIKFAYSLATSRRSLSEKFTKGLDFILRRGRWNNDG